MFGSLLRSLWSFPRPHWVVSSASLAAGWCWESRRYVCVIADQTTRQNWFPVYELSSSVWPSSAPWHLPHYDSSPWCHQGAAGVKTMQCPAQVTLPCMESGERRVSWALTVNWASVATPGPPPPTHDHIGVDTGVTPGVSHGPIRTRVLSHSANQIITLNTSDSHYHQRSLTSAQTRHLFHDNTQITTSTMFF